MRDKELEKQRRNARKNKRSNFDEEFTYYESPKSNSNKNKIKKKKQSHFIDDIEDDDCTARKRK